MALRSIWRGTISFGLVSVPVSMYTATESKELRFHFLHKDDLSPIGYDKVRKDTGERVDREDIVRGFEIEKGQYVPLEDEDLDRLDIELTKSIDICDFVDLDEIDPIYFRKAYYLRSRWSRTSASRSIPRSTTTRTARSCSTFCARRPGVRSCPSQRPRRRERSST
jgi:Ku protein